MIAESSVESNTHSKVGALYVHFHVAMWPGTSRFGHLVTWKTNA